MPDNALKHDNGMVLRTFHVRSTYTVVNMHHTVVILLCIETNRTKNANLEKGIQLLVRSRLI